MRILFSFLWLLIGLGGEVAHSQSGTDTKIQVEEGLKVSDFFASTKTNERSRALNPLIAESEGLDEPKIKELREGFNQLTNELDKIEDSVVDFSDQVNVLINNIRELIKAQKDAEGNVPDTERIIFELNTQKDKLTELTGNNNYFEEIEASISEILRLETELGDANPEQRGVLNGKIKNAEEGLESRKVAASLTANQHDKTQKAQKIVDELCGEGKKTINSVDEARKEGFKCLKKKETALPRFLLDQCYSACGRAEKGCSSHYENVRSYYDVENWSQGNWSLGENEVNNPYLLNPLVKRYKSFIAQIDSCDSPTSIRDLLPNVEIGADSVKTEQAIGNLKSLLVDKIFLYVKRAGALLAILMLLWGAIELIANHDKESGISRLKNMIVATVLGLAVFMLSGVLVEDVIFQQGTTFVESGENIAAGMEKGREEIKGIYDFARNVLVVIAVGYLIFNVLIMIFSSNEESSFTNLRQHIILSAIGVSAVLGLDRLVNTYFFGISGIQADPNREGALNALSGVDVLGIAREITVWTNRLLGLVAIIAVTALVYAGIRLITYYGDEKGEAEAKTIGQYAIIGLVVAGTSWVLVRFFLLGGTGSEI